MHQSDTPQGLPHRADELQDAPGLQRLRDQVSGTVPEGYFNTFSSRLADRMQDADALAEAPTLRSIGRKLEPAAPEGYFEALPARIMAQVPRARVRKLWQRPEVWAIAAGIIVLLAIAPLINRPAQPDSERMLASLSDQELLALADYSLSEAEDVAAVFSLEDVSLTDLESFEDDEAEALLESIELSEDDIVELLNESTE